MIMNYSEDLIKQKKELIEDLGVCFETCESMSPLSSRIYALLILTGSHGLTFEELTETLCASKSSISTNLQLLQTEGIIAYKTLPGERKRYFKICDNQLNSRIDKRIEGWEKEKALHSKILKYRENLLELNPEITDIKQGIKFNQLQIDLMDAMITNLKNLKQQIQDN